MKHNLVVSGSYGRTSVLNHIIHILQEARLQYSVMKAERNKPLISLNETHNDDTMQIFDIEPCFLKEFMERNQTDYLILTAISDGDFALYMDKIGLINARYTILPHDYLKKFFYSNSIYTYGIELNAQCYATNIKLGYTSTKFQVIFDSKKYNFEIFVIGLVNVLNALAAILFSLLRQIFYKFIERGLRIWGGKDGVYFYQRLKNSDQVHLFLNIAGYNSVYFIQIFSDLSMGKMISYIKNIPDNIAAYELLKTIKSLSQSMYINMDLYVKNILPYEVGIEYYKYAILDGSLDQNKADTERILYLNVL